MEQKELLRAKRQLKHNNDKLLIYSISAHYVNTEGEVSVSTTKKFCEERDMKQGKSGMENYWDLPEENVFLDIIKKTMSATLGKDMTEYKLSDDVVDKLNKLKATNLTPEACLSYAQYMANKLKIVGDYAIILSSIEITEAVKTGDGIHNANTRDDDLLSGDIDSWSFITASICTTSPVKIGVIADRNAKKVKKYDSFDKEIKAPIAGFIFPAKDNDNVALVYNSLSNPVFSLVSEVLSSEVMRTPEQEKAVIKKVIKESVSLLNSDAKKDIIPDKILEDIITESENLDKEAIETVLTRNNIPTTAVDEVIEDAYEEIKDIKEIKINTTPIAKTIKKPSVSVSIDVKDSAAVYSDTHNGEKCFIIPMTDSVRVKCKIDVRV